VAKQTEKLKHVLVGSQVRGMFKTSGIYFSVFVDCYMAVRIDGCQNAAVKQEPK
jgi:hypothetical protein